MKYLTICGLSALLTFTVLTGAPARAQSFFDDFEDNNLSDGSPVTWDLIDSDGTSSVVSGDLVLTPNNGGPCCVGANVDFPHSDLAIDTTAQWPTDDDIFVAVGFRDTRDGLSGGYWAGALGTGEIGIGYSVPGNNVTAVRGVFLPTGPIAPGTDVTFHLENIGNSITFSAWETIAGPQSAATIDWTDTNNRFPTGNLVSPFINPTGSTESVRFRSFGATIIPEPNGLSSIAMAALAGILARRRRRAS